MASKLHDNAIVIDGLIISNFDRAVFEDMRKGGLTAANCTCSIWENFRGSMDNVARWKKHFTDNADLITQVHTTADIRRAKEQNKTGIILGWQNLTGIEDQIGFLQLFKDLSADCFADNPLGTKDDGALADFATGKALMLATGTFSMGPALKLNPKLNFGLYVPLTTPVGTTPKWEGIYNATFIVGVNARQKDPKKQAAAIKFVDWLSQPENAAKYANGTSQHSTVAGVKYVTKELQDTGVWADKRVLLAPRFQFLNLDVRNAVEDAFLAVAGGKDAKAAAAEAQAIIDQKLGVK